MKEIKAVLSISMGWPVRSYKAMTKWKKLDFRKFGGGCFSKWALPIPGATLLNINIVTKYVNGKTKILLADDENDDEGEKFPMGKSNAGEASKMNANEPKKLRTTFFFRYVIGGKVFRFCTPYNNWNPKPIFFIAWVSGKVNKIEAKKTLSAFKGLAIYFMECKCFARQLF